MEFNATFIVSAVSFIVFVFIMNAIFYKPLEQIVEKRKKFIDDNYAHATEAANKSSFLLKDRDEKLSKANGNARKLMLESTEKAKNEKEDLHLKTKNKITEEIKIKKKDLESASKEAADALKMNVGILAETISSKLLGENIKISDIDNSIVDKIMHEG